MFVRRFGTDSQGSALVDQGMDAFFARTLARGSCRDFLERPVEDDLFDLIVATALCASSKSDLQQASIVEIASPEQRAAVVALVPDQAWLAKAPRLLAVCADAQRYQAIAMLEGVVIDNGNLEGFFNATVDAALVLQTLILAAEAAGLGTCPLSSLRHQAPALARLLMLPPRVTPIAGLAFGYPSNAPAVRARLPRNLTIHRDHYTADDLEASIRSYDQLRQASSAREGGQAQRWSQDRAFHHDPARAKLFRSFVKAAGFDLGDDEHDVREPRA